MSSPHSLMHASRALLGAFAAAGALVLAAATPAAAQQVTMETLLDRINIEDLLVRYYYDLASGKAHEMSEYFTEDAMLDVDGTIAKGRAEIEKLYGGGSRARDPNAAPRPHNGMLLTNPVIEIKGNKAQAHVIWTGVSNKGVGQAPSLYEQGREDSELVKVNGKWLISKRYISSDSGLPDRFDQTFKQRDNPLPPL
ncbi:MAG TPA: nuclear transport factor 2 family protein [Gammaproteobacteria bacterium]|nr:nuclear transport factor 2 family protein [Gammaproteobacteria bacterium]